MCAVAVVVTHAGRVVDEVPAVDIVLKAVVVVVGVLSTRGLQWVGPDVLGQIGVLNIYTRVDDGDDGALGGNLIDGP